MLKDFIQSSLSKEQLQVYFDEPAFLSNQDPQSPIANPKGMTKLEFVSAMALTGNLSNSQYRMVDQVDVERCSIKRAMTLLTELYEETRMGKKPEERKI